MLEGHKLTDAQTKEVNFAILHAIASPDSFIQEKAARVLKRMGVMERWRLGRLIDNIAAPARPSVRENFAAFMVGMLPEDFTGTPVREYESGQRIFASGDDAPEAFLVEEGSVLISKNGRRVATFAKNEFFGNLPFLIPVKRTADAFAFTKVKVRVLSREEYLKKFHTYSTQRQADEFLLAHTMIRQLIAGFARYESSVKVLADYLLPDLTRHEQEDTLVRWTEQFISPQRFGLERIFALFNLLEMLDGELLLLAHLDTADKQVLATIQETKGILHGVGISRLKSPHQGLALLENPPVMHRLLNNLGSAGGITPQSLEVVCLADFLMPTTGNRKHELSTADIESLRKMLHPEGIIYYAGNANSGNLKRLCQAGFNNIELAMGLHVLATSELSDTPAFTRPTSHDRPAGATGFFKRLLGWS
jgi:CRP-like cAMP-binding protein